MSTSPPPQPKTSRPSVVPKAVGLNCPNCGSAMTLRTFSNAVNVVCPSCASVLDATDPKLRILQESHAREKLKPLIPLGTRGNWKGTTYEIVGLQRRTIRVDSIDYDWFEYLLFNPYAGYRYLTEYEGHWNDVTVCRAIPKQVASTSKPTMIMGERTFKHFQSAQAETTYILGEFPWQVRVNDQVHGADYISPPFMLSGETTEQETTWSLGEYTSGKDIWQAFKLSGSAPTPRGVFANQPSPFGDRPKGYWSNAALFVSLALVILFAAYVTAVNKEIFKESYSYSQRQGQEASFVTPVFEVPGHTSNVELKIDTDLANNWTYFSFALINEQTGEAYDFGREVSYYYGSDSDGSWTEGSRTNTAVVPTVPPGHYYLRVEPEMAADAIPVHYTLELDRDVPSVSFFFIAALMLLIPPALLTARAYRFEYRRWQESDYAVSSGGDSDDE